MTTAAAGGCPTGCAFLVRASRMLAIHAALNCPGILGTHILRVVGALAIRAEGAGAGGAGGAGAGGLGSPDAAAEDGAYMRAYVVSWRGLHADCPGQTVAACECASLCLARHGPRYRLHDRLCGFVHIVTRGKA